MYYVYVIESLSHGTRYVGSTHDVEGRLREHNMGRCRYTKGRRPWGLVCQEAYGSRAEAMRRERFLKSGQGRECLDLFLFSAAGSSSGRMRHSGCRHLGSNPSPAALNGNLGSPPPADSP